MAKRGAPKTKPTGLKLLQGTARPDRVNPAEPKLAVGAPEMPPDLSEYGRQVWERMVVHLTKMGVLTPVDGEVLAIYCDHAEEAHTAKLRIRQEGQLLDGKKHPAMMIREKALAEMRLLLPEFGLTPASRGKVNSLTVDEENPLKGLLR